MFFKSTAQKDKLKLLLSINSGLIIVFLLSLRFLIQYNYSFAQKVDNSFNYYYGNYYYFTNNNFHPL